MGSTEKAMHAQRTGGEERMPGSVARVLGPLALVVSGILVALAAGEVIVRFAFPPVPQTMFEGRLIDSAAYEPHPVLHWRPRPDATFHDERFGVTYRTNSRGLRDREHALQRVPGIARVVVLGDSFTWGYGVHEDATFARRMEAGLERTEVVNLGVTAYGVRQAFDYLKLEGALYRPDVVVLALCQNDVIATVLAAGSPGAPETPREEAAWNVALKRWFARNSALYRLAQQAINVNRPLSKAMVAIGLKDELTGFAGLDHSLMPALWTYPPQLQSAWDRVLAELTEMRDWLAQREMRFVLALVPARQAMESRAFLHSIAYTVFEPSDFDLDKPYRRLEAFARDNAIEIVNPYPAFRRHYNAGGGSLYLPNDMHFNAEGHALFARELVAHLKRTALTPHPHAGEPNRRPEVEQR